MFFLLILRSKIVRMMGFSEETSIKVENAERRFHLIMTVRVYLRFQQVEPNGLQIPNEHFQCKLIFN